ncbi:MAG: hypothetical protein PHO03_02390 [Candidatus Omnitrophica bacterium]|nr:hypothetical protein [Candidatus Omnitrophota bacterium]
MLISYSGCLLPLLIVLNLFFGQFFFKASQWLAIEGILVALFLLNSYIVTRRFKSSQRNNPKNVIDVEGKVVEDK